MFLSLPKPTVFDPHIVGRRFCPSRPSAMRTLPRLLWS